LKLYIRAKSVLNGRHETATAKRGRLARPFILDIRIWISQPDKAMKTRTLLTLFAIVCAASALAQSANYTAAEAAKHVGETATVTDKVDGVHRSRKGHFLLNMGGKYPNQTFSAFIPAASASQFSEFRQYEGRTVTVSGKIVMHGRKPEIVVTSQVQLTVK
jgi:hypothetical protein